MIVVGDDDVLKVHIHTDFPGDVLQFCASLGNVTEIAIDNMYLQNLDYEGHRQQHRLNLEEDNVVGFPPRREEEKAKPLGLVAVVPGAGPGGDLPQPGRRLYCLGRADNEPKHGRARQSS